MPKKDLEPIVVPYENTLYDFLVDKIKGKYFQNYLNPHLIAHFPKENELRIHLIEDNNLSAWFPLTNNWGAIRLEEFNLYVEITEEQFNKYKKEKINLSNVVLAHKNSDVFKEYHKANLSSGFDAKKLNENSKRIQEIIKGRNKLNLSARGGINPGFDTDPNDTDSKESHQRYH